MVSFETIVHVPATLLTLCAEASPAGSASERSRSEAEIAASVFRRFMIFSLDGGWGRGAPCLALPTAMVLLVSAGLTGRCAAVTRVAATRAIRGRHMRAG